MTHLSEYDSRTCLESNSDGSRRIAGVKAFPYAVLILGWLLWLAPFLLLGVRSGTAKQVDRRARWGIILEAVAFSVLWQGRFWERSPLPWQIGLSVVLLLLGALLSWTAKRALGRQWRLDAGLNTDHELITSGPYHVVRHPIYTSMLCMLLGTGVMVTPWWLISISLLLFLIGTEIRVRIEDQLLSSNFGEGFRTYKQRVRSYVPLLR
jgi:protein-S-isoprenylcysteine O-methyltransferase Ste14